MKGLLGLLILLVMTASTSAQSSLSEPRPLDDRQAKMADSIREALRQRLGYPPLPYADRESASTIQGGSAAVPTTRTLTLDELIKAIDPLPSKAARCRHLAAHRLGEAAGEAGGVRSAHLCRLRLSAIQYRVRPEDACAASRHSSNLTDAGIEILTRSGLKIGAGARYNLGKIKALSRRRAMVASTF
jgi:hypothetical protein